MLRRSALAFPAGRSAAAAVMLAALALTGCKVQVTAGGPGSPDGSPAATVSSGPGTYPGPAGSAGSRSGPLITEPGAGSLPSTA